MRKNEISNLFNDFNPTYDLLFRKDGQHNYVRW